MPASHAHAGTRANRLTKLGLAEAGRQLLRLGIVWADADLRRSLRHLARHGFAHRLASRRLLERRYVEIRCAFQCVLGGGQLPRGRTHRRAQVVVTQQPLELSGQRVHLAFVRGHLDGDGVGQLGEPAHVRDDERPAG